MTTITWSKGPSEQEWEQNREAITWLYNTTTIKNLQKLMQLRGFRASEKMYKTKLKQWGLSKNMKASEKDQIIKTLEEKSQDGSSPSEISELGTKEVEKLLRHIRSKSTNQSPRATSRSLTPESQCACEARKVTNNSLSPSFPLYLASFNHRTDHGLVDMRLMFYSLQASCTFPVMNSDSSTLATKEFWNDVKQSIYLLRVSSSERAWPTLEKACGLAENALLTTDICAFIREVLETLSPSNTKDSPAVRFHLLRYLADMARIELPYNHPVTIILQQLCSDSGTRDVSERCLAYMSEMLYARKDRNELLIRSQLGMSRLLRKDGEHDTALSVASQMHAMSVHLFGAGSIQACWALRQKEHVYIDQRNYTAALETCFEILGQDRFGEDVVAHTKCAIHTMEDLACIFEKLGNWESRNEWLVRAREAALCLWGESVALGHIEDKLMAAEGDFQKEKCLNGLVLIEGLPFQLD